MQKWTDEFKLGQRVRHQASGMTVTIVGIWIGRQATIRFEASTDDYIVEFDDLEAV